MAAFDFPGSPTDGQVYTANGVTYVYSTAEAAWTGGPVYDSGLYQPKDVNITALANLSDAAVGFPSSTVPAAPAVTPKVTIAEFRGGTATPRLLANKVVWDAAAEVTIAYTASWTPDMATFINASMTLTGALAINNPSNPVLGPLRGDCPDCCGRSSFELRQPMVLRRGRQTRPRAIGESVLYYYVRSGKIHATFVGPYTNA
jgi:hypothetical protein